jgi:hypothetical protein
LARAENAKETAEQQLVKKHAVKVPTVIPEAISNVQGSSGVREVI